MIIDALIDIAYWLTFCLVMWLIHKTLCGAVNITIDKIKRFY